MTRRAKDGVRVAPSPEAAGELVAERMAALLADAAPSGRRVVLGFPAGRTPRTTIAALARLAALRALDLSRLEIAMMDEYVVPEAGRWTYCPLGAPTSCRRFAERELRAVLNAGLPPARQLPARQLHFPDPARPEAYDDELAARGGVDLFLLAAGESDGHVAFNPPGTDLATRTRIVELAASTRHDNLATFPALRELGEVPRQGVSVGLGTIAQQARHALLVLLGASKRSTLARTLALGRFDPAWPASVVFACRSAEIIADAEAWALPAAAASAGN